MAGPDPAVALTRRAVRLALQRLERQPTSGDARLQPERIVVGLSGGADSLALVAALAFEAPKRGLDVIPVIVDHGLQGGSRAVADRAAHQCQDQLHLKATVCSVQVKTTGAGLEADARTARLAALRDIARERDASCIALGHTGDDQAEQVLLGLMRGSGTRSLAGMRVHVGDLLRPFLLGPPHLPEGPVMRGDTLAACASLGLTAWQDPHNEDERFTRVRARTVLHRLERELPAPSLRKALVRTADSAARDADLLDRLTDEALARVAGTADTELWPSAWPVELLAALDPALRIRALRRLLMLAGAPGSELTARHLYEVEGLLVAWRGQGPLNLPGHLNVARSGGEVAIWVRRGTQ